MVSFHHLVRDFPSDYFLAKTYLPWTVASGRRLDELRLTINMAIFGPLVQTNSVKQLVVAEEGRMIWRRFRSVDDEPTYYSFGQRVGMAAERSLVHELYKAAKEKIEIRGRGVVAATENVIVFWPTATLKFNKYLQ